MEDGMKGRLTRRSIWVRFLYMLAFMIAYSIAEIVLGIVVLLQFVIVLITGSANENLLRLGNNLSAFVYQVFRFLTFNTEEHAFPFADWPDEAINEDNVWTQPEAEWVDENPEAADASESQFEPESQFDPESQAEPESQAGPEGTPAAADSAPEQGISPDQGTHTDESVRPGEGGNEDAPKS
jgi:hypothetical protein